jgi:uncharacterized membrane protein
MDKRIIGVTIGVAGIFLWFMPLASWTENFVGSSINVFQAGYHIGGIAYLLLFSMLAYSVFSWFKLYPLRIITGALSLLICLMFLVQIGSNIGWGLIGLILVSILGIVLGIMDNKKQKTEQLDEQK